MFLGFGVAVIHLLYYVYTSFMTAEEISMTNHGYYAIYLVSLNLFMKGFRLFIEFKLRTMILNRRQLLSQNFKLRVIAIVG